MTELLIGGLIIVVVVMAGIETLWTILTGGDK